MQIVATICRVWRDLVGGGKRRPQPAEGKERVDASAPEPTPASVKEQDQPSSPSPEGELADGEGSPDDLTVIRGIGPARSRRLHAAGISSYSQLANASPEDLRKALSEQNQQVKVKVEAWISEARELARRE